MARQLIENLTAEWNPEEFTDEYREALLPHRRGQDQRRGDRDRRGRAHRQGRRPDGGPEGERGGRQEAGRRRRTDRPAVDPRSGSPRSPRRRRPPQEVHREEDDGSQEGRRRVTTAARARTPRATGPPDGCRRVTSASSVRCRRSLQATEVAWPGIAVAVAAVARSAGTPGRARASPMSLRALGDRRSPAGSARPPWPGGSSRGRRRFARSSRASRSNERSGRHPSPRTRAEATCVVRASDLGDIPSGRDAAADHRSSWPLARWRSGRLDEGRVVRVLGEGSRCGRDPRRGLPAAGARRRRRPVFASRRAPCETPSTWVAASVVVRRLGCSAPSEAGIGASNRRQRGTQPSR